MNYETIEDIDQENLEDILLGCRVKDRRISIGGKTGWLRRCNHCSTIVLHTSRQPYLTAIKINKKCEKCRQPMGVHNSFYGKKFSEIQIEKWKLDRSNEKNPMFGSLGGMFSKKQSDQQKQTISTYKKKWWKSKGSIDPIGFKKYRREVDRLTKQQDIKSLKDFDKRGKAGIDGAYHLDHIMSVYNGYNNKIPANNIADISNLRFIPWMENQKKWFK